MFGVPPEQSREHDGQDDGEEETQGTGLHAIAQVHAKEAGHQCRHHEEHGDDGQRLHHRGHVVINNVRVGVHGGFQDVGRLNTNGQEGKRLAKELNPQIKEQKGRAEFAATRQDAKERLKELKSEKKALKGRKD